MINDVARAIFEAKAIRKICVELPEECAESLGGRNVALLSRSLWRTWSCHELARRSSEGDASVGVSAEVIITHVYIYIQHDMCRCFYMEMTLQALATERRYSGFERGWKEGSRSKRVSLVLGSEKFKKPGC